METQSVHPFVLPLPKRGSVDTPFDEKATCAVLNKKDPAHVIRFDYQVVTFR